MRPCYLTITIAANVAFSARAFGYAVNSHVAICEDVLDTIRDEGGVWLKPPPAPPNTCPAVVGPQFMEVPGSVRSDLLANPSYFRAGCVAPDAHITAMLTGVTHSEEIDPLGLSKLLIAEAQTPAERAYAWGWLAHIAQDVAVHGFATFYAGGVWGEFSPSDPSTWIRVVNHMRVEVYVRENWVKTPDPPPAMSVPTDFLASQFFHKNGPALKWLLSHRDRRPTLGALERASIWILDAVASADDYLSNLAQKAQHESSVSNAEAQRIAREHSWTFGLRPSYYLASARSYFFGQAAQALGEAWRGIRALKFEFINKNIEYASGLYAGGGNLSTALKDYLTWLIALPLRILETALTAAWRLLPDWVESLASTVWGAIADAASSVLGDVRAWIRTTFDRLKSWLIEAARFAGHLVASSVPSFVTDAWIGFRDMVIDATFPLDYSMVDDDFLAAGASKGHAATGDNRDCLRGYHFYHGGRLLTIAGLADPANLDGMRTPDGACEYRRTDFFAKYDRGEYANFLHNVGPSPPFEYPYCFFGNGWKDTPYLPARDWRWVDVCEAGQSVHKKVPYRACGTRGPPLGNCAAGKGYFLTTKEVPPSCTAEYDWILAIWSAQPGVPVAEAARTDLRNSATEDRVIETLTLSPDGSAVALLTQDLTLNQQENPPAWHSAYTIRVLRGSGTPLATVFSEPFETGSKIEWSPWTTYIPIAKTVSWSPDGARIVFHRKDAGFKKGRGAIVVVDATSGAKSEIANGAAPFWSPDGKSVIVYRERATAPDGGSGGGIDRVPLSGCAPEPVTPAGAAYREWPLAVSRDGKILFAAAQPATGAGTDELYTYAGKLGVRSADGTQSTLFGTPGIGWPAFATWSPDGTRVALISNAPYPALPGPDEVYLVDFGAPGFPPSGRAPTITDLGLGSMPAFSPDGRYLAFGQAIPAPNTCAGSNSVTVRDLTAQPQTTWSLGLPSDATSCPVLDSYQPFAWAVASASPAVYASISTHKPIVSPPQTDYDLFQNDITGGGWQNLTAQLLGHIGYSGDNPCAAPMKPSNEFAVTGGAR